MERIEQICEILNKYDKYLQAELKEPTDKNVALYEHWIECAYDVEKRLKELVELKKKGKLLKLPCAVGDTVYRINKGKKEPIIPMRVIGIAIRNENELVIQTKDIADDNHNLYSKKQYQQNCFPHKEAAEDALEELERGKEE